MGQEAYHSEKPDRLQGYSEMMGLPDYNAWEIVKRTNACLMEDPYWLRFSEEENFADTTRGRARKIMSENQKNTSW